MYLDYPANSTGDGGAGTHHTSGACENEGRCPLVLRRQDRDTQKGELCVWQRRPAAARTRALLKSVIWETEEEKPRPSSFESPEKRPGWRPCTKRWEPTRKGWPRGASVLIGNWGTPRDSLGDPWPQLWGHNRKASPHLPEPALCPSPPRGHAAAGHACGGPPGAPVTWLHLCHSPVCAGRGGPTRQAAKSTPGLPALESHLSPQRRLLRGSHTPVARICVVPGCRPRLSLAGLLPPGWASTARRPEARRPSWDSDPDPSSDPALRGHVGGWASLQWGWFPQVRSVMLGVVSLDGQWSLGPRSSEAEPQAHGAVGGVGACPPTC